MFISFEPYAKQYKNKQLALYHALRDAIMSGQLAKNERLLSTRELAKQLQISRGTVNVVYEMLISQELLYTKHGSGTYVNSVKKQIERATVDDDHVTLSDWGSRLMVLSGGVWQQKAKETHSKAAVKVGNETQVIDFNMSKVELAYFPYKQWNHHLYEQIRKQYEHEVEDQYATEGHGKLRDMIALQLRKERGIYTTAEQIIIFNGSQQAITLAVQLIMNENDIAYIENPHYIGTRSAIQAAGGIINTFPVDEKGIVLPVAAPPCKLIAVTPSRQFPTGAVLSYDRRMKLLQWAQQNGSFIIEDDYDSEFHYSGRAAEPLKSLDYNDQVIYVGTFSRTMMQQIRLGYAVVPKRLHQAFILAKMIFERHPSSIIQQRALSSFIESGQYDKHLRKIKRIYRDRHEWIQQQIKLKLSSWFDMLPTRAGLHIYMTWKCDEQSFEQFLYESQLIKVKVYDARSYYTGNSELALCVGFAHLTKQEIEEGISRIKLAARKCFNV